jgi:predicted N-formylglutamate amidohydrolase
VQQTLESIVRSGAIAIHLSVHTFTPVFRGARRRLDIGLLFDPGRARETTLCTHWRNILRHRHPRLRVELNQPYLGIDDGLTTAMRTALPAPNYLGIELEINNQVRRRSLAGRQRFWRALLESLRESISSSALRLDNCS